ncbi:putative ribosome-binding factor A, mitochondrial [Brachyhypopomus gauderio]|uniref:putative ribosome-binding factor A, mitochondrial n=1 Tax=Brachyhypopomus gauderio TaxID=698409 RepID=UPI004042B595
MLALNGCCWLKKCWVPRHVKGIVTVSNKMTLGRCENRTNNTSRLQPPGSIMNVHSSALQCRNLVMKMLTSKRKKKWYEPSQYVAVGQPGLQRPPKKHHEDSVRVRTLNIILYKALSDLLTSHEVNADITSYDVEITKVSLSADFSACRVYWKTSWTSEQDGKIQQVLDKSAPRIRYLLISQQVLGSVPPLVFVKDKHHASLKEVENLLKTADYGPSEDSDHLPLSGADSEIRLQSSEPGKEKAVPFFGIDHDALHKQIEDYKQRPRAPYSPGPSSAQLTQEQLDALAAIRKQRLIEKKKRRSKVIDDDLTPKEFLLARQRQAELEEQDYSENELEDSQIAQLMEDENLKH